jgi:hypothetical protein
MSLAQHRVSDLTYKLLIEFEVGGGRPYYESRLKRPTWPGGESGVTIGVGFDCGYNDHRTILNVWTSAGLDEHDAGRLAATAGITGRAAKAAAANLHDITISWDAAWWVFNEITLRRFIELTVTTYPEADKKLTADGFGALVSLVFNRGAGMGEQGKPSWERRKHMRLLKHLIYTGEPGSGLQKKCADVIRAMIPLWQGTDIEEGMRRRREAEAQLMEGTYV